MSDLSDYIPVKRALISVSDKTGIVNFARALSSLGVEILSTGGTFKLLIEEGIAAKEVSDYTGFPEMMDGRVKTLHPKVHGGILGRRGQDDQVMAEHGIQAIDMVVVNLYPFAETVAKPNCDLPTAIENIDIGGPTMVRSSAKNHQWVNIIVNTSDYQSVLDEMMQNNGSTCLATRYDLAVKAFEHTAQYDGMIANYLGARNCENEKRDFPNTFNTQFTLAQTMRYGENPHQNAAFYVENKQTEACIGNAKQLQGKEMSFNNVADTDAALETVKQFDEPACVIVKHANPCGVAVAQDIKLAYDLAYATDSESAFGGIIAFNRELDADTVKAIVERQFVEVIIAPTIARDALVLLSEKKNIRVLVCGSLKGSKVSGLDYKRVTGGLLVQDRDAGMVNKNNLNVVTKLAPTEQQMNDMLFAWKVAKMVKSNAIIYAKDGRTIGVGAGQMSRVNSARIAAIKAEHAGLEVAGAVMASDAFFPFRDGIDNAAAVGIKAVIQPGGSMRDDEVIAAADEHGMTMVFTGMRHFRH